MCIITLRVCGPVAQVAEPPAHNRKVGGSSPPGPTMGRESVQGWPHRIMVSIPAFQAGGAGSIPAGATNKIKEGGYPLLLFLRYRLYHYNTATLISRHSSETIFINTFTVEKLSTISANCSSNLSGHSMKTTYPLSNLSTISSSISVS